MHFVKNYNFNSNIKCKKKILITNPSSGCNRLSTHQCVLKSHRIWSCHTHTDCRSIFLLVSATTNVCYECLVYVSVSRFVCACNNVLITSPRVQIYLYCVDFFFSLLLFNFFTSLLVVPGVLIFHLNFSEVKKKKKKTKTTRIKIK